MINFKRCFNKWKEWKKYETVSWKFHNYDLLMFTKVVAHQGCIYLIKNTVKTVILWNIKITVDIYIYAFSRRFYPKRHTVHSGYTFLSVCVFPGNRTHDLCAANAMLYHWATGTVIYFNIF